MHFKYEHEYEYHFIEYEYDGKPNCATSKAPPGDAMHRRLLPPELEMHT
jgi:hypothetical protein